MGTATGLRVPCIKYALFGFNIVFTVVGLLILVLGVWLKSSPQTRDFLSEEYRRAVGQSVWDANTLYLFTWILMGLGCVMILVCFIGFCATAREMSCLLITYCVTVFIIFCLTLGAGILLLYKKDAVRNEVNDAMTYMVQHYYQGPDIIHQAADQIQSTFRCCGNSGCGDYHDLRLDIPRSCDYACDGCGERIYRALRIGSIIAGTVFIIVIVCQLVGMLLSLLLVCWSHGYSSRVLRYGDIRVVEGAPAEGPGPPPAKLLAAPSPHPQTTQTQGFYNPLQGNEDGGQDMGPGPPPPYAFFAAKHTSYRNS